MKKYLFLTILLLPLLFFKIPKYVELNNLIIIDSIGIDCKNNNIYYREIIPIKDDDGIEKKYKIYKSNMNGHNSNKLYLNDIKYVITNCPKSKLNNYINTNKKKIIITNHIKKELRKHS